MTVYVEADKKIRKVKVTWMVAGDEEKLPPQTWADSARGEVEYQQAEEKSHGLSRFMR